MIATVLSLVAEGRKAGERKRENEFNNQAIRQIHVNKFGEYSNTIVLLYGGFIASFAFLTRFLSVAISRLERNQQP